MCLAQGTQCGDAERLECVASRSRVKISTTEPLRSLFSVGLTTVDIVLYHYKIVVPLFGAAYAAPNKGTSI